MFAQIRPLACALAMLALASLLIASQVDAGLKDLLRARDKSYERLANKLFENIMTDALHDNAVYACDAHFTCEPKDGDQAYCNLLHAFYLQGINLDDKYLCGADNLEELHHLARVMVAQGNLGPNRITNAIERLNLIIIRQIVKARGVCFNYLAKKWPKSWNVPEVFGEMYKNLHKLDSLPRTLLLDSQPNLDAKKLDYMYNDNMDMSCVLLQKGIAGELLKPYVNLLMTSHIIDPESKRMAEFYTVTQPQTVLAPAVEHPNQELLANAYRFRACELLVANSN